LAGFPTNRSAGFMSPRALGRVGYLTHTSGFNSIVLQKKRIINPKNNKKHIYFINH